MTSHLPAIELANWAESAMPIASSAAGTDATGAVMVALGPDGRVTDIRIDDAWTRHLSPQTLGEAVREAVRETALFRLAAWSDEPATLDPSPGTAAEWHAGRSPDRTATVLVTAGGDVAEVRYDTGWLAGATATTIGDRTLSAFTAAYRSADHNSVAIAG